MENFAFFILFCSGSIPKFRAALKFTFSRLQLKKVAAVRSEFSKEDMVRSALEKSTSLREQFAKLVLFNLRPKNTL